jgi:hypothetical protein
MGRLGFILTGQYKYTKLKDQTEVFYNDTDQISIPKMHAITLRQLLFTCYRYSVLEDGTEVFQNNDYTFYI